MNNVKLCAIVAMSQNNVIGKNNDLPWHIPADLKHFKKTTMNKPIIMGRKCYESIGRPLPGRPNLIISRSWSKIKDTPETQLHKTLEAAAPTPDTKVNPGPFLYNTIDDAITAAEHYAQENNLDEIFIAGGGEIYKQTLDRIDRLYLTIIHKDIEGDTYFPDINFSNWNEVANEHHKEETPFSFINLERR